MVNISFDYNPETKSVTNIKVADLTVSTPAKSKQPKTKSDDTKIQLNGSSLKLTQEALDLLGVTTGERLCIRFNKNPIIATPQALGETNGGNLVTKSMTVACKGKTGETLGRYGTEFSYSLDSEGYLVLYGSDAETEIPKETEEIKSVIDNSDFDLAIVDGEEVEFGFSK